MRSLWTKFLTGIAVAGTLISVATTASAGGNKFSFGGSGSGGNSQRSLNLSSSNQGSNSLRFTQRSLSGGTTSAVKSQSFGASAFGQTQLKSRTLNLQNGNFSGLTANNQFKNLNRNPQLNSKLNTQILGNVNLKGLNQIGNGRTIQAGKGLNNLKAQGFAGNQHNLGLFVGKQLGSQKSAFCVTPGSNKCGWWWNNCGPSFCKPCYPWWYDCYSYDCYPYYYGCYPYWSYRQITYQVAQPDLALVDVRVINPGNGVDEAPLLSITIVNRGQATSSAFRTMILAAASNEQLESAARATVLVGPMRPNQTANVAVRLPLEAMAIPSPAGAAPFQVLGVVVDELNQVVESDELNNRGLIDRDSLRMADGAAVASFVQPSTVARQLTPPPMISLPRQF